MIKLLNELLTALPLSVNTSTLSNKSTMSKAICKTTARIALATVVGSASLLSSAIAQAADTANSANTTISVDLAGTHATKHEIAVLQVLSEICPPMLSTQQRDGFYKAYNRELKELLPTIKDPRAAINYLSTQQDYKTILSSMRNWTMGYPREDNLALCVDLAEAKFQDDKHQVTLAIVSNIDNCYKTGEQSYISYIASESNPVTVVKLIGYN